MPVRRFGETIIAFRDPDGMSLELRATDGAAAIHGWSNGDVPAEHAIRGFAGITLHSARPDSTAAVLSVMGYGEAASEDGVTRWTTAAPGLATTIDVRDASRDARHLSGAGTVHHVAFRAADDAAQQAMVSALAARGLQVTEQVDRNYFRSVYFGSRAACCSRSRPTIRASRSTSRPGRSAAS